MTFGNLRLLLALAGLVPILVVAYAFDGQRRRRLIERIGHLPMLSKMIVSSSPGRRRWKAVLTVTAVALLSIALGRPQIPGRAKLTESRGLDLVVALDFSKSMLARDVYPSRIERAKAELNRLIDGLKGDRVGLVAFAGETLAYPITVDYEAAKLFWRDLGPNDMPVGGTDLGRALRAAIDLLERARRPDQKKKPAEVILLLTDGEDTEGQGALAAAEAKAKGIKIFTLGIGTKERPFVQLYDEDGKSAGYLTGEDGQPVRVGVDENALRQMATSTGGDYVAIDPQRFGVERVQEAIARLERTQEEARYEREPEDVGRFFLVAAFILLMGEACVRERKRVRQNAAPTVENRGELRRAAMILLMLLPMLTGFDVWTRRDPDVEAGNRALRAGKPADALEAYDRAEKRLHDDPIVKFDRGAALYELGRYEDAQKEFARAAEGRDPQLKADSYYNMGNSLLKQQKWKDAVGAYKSALGLRPEDRRAKWNLELALRKLQEQQPPPPQPQSQNQDQKKDNEKKQDQNQAQQQKTDDQQRKQEEQKQQEAQEKEKEAKKEPLKEIDKQDAEAVLDALERVEPTVQKELAKRRAQNRRRPTKDY